ncbi:uncharacterized protein A4U43_C10F5570 [Asparagus officinalis]|uniref:Uncharacterized protein n=1 Tax=Asparagus officinalis TaxID=4686 RepID=A0A5P1E0Y5_ASPOF|nr:uncharacterized protein A4U43_C10F5570 [Asparagus officinalis]
MYTVPMGLGACVSTRVGNELGAGKPKRAKLAAMVALGHAPPLIGVINVFVQPRHSANNAGLPLHHATPPSFQLAASVMPPHGLWRARQLPQTHLAAGVALRARRPSPRRRCNDQPDVVLSGGGRRWRSGWLFWLRSGSAGSGTELLSRGRWRALVFGAWWSGCVGKTRLGSEAMPGRQKLDDDDGGRLFAEGHRV